MRGAHRAAPARATSGERLQKVLSDLGVASRREVERWIRAGRLTINGKTAVLGMRVTSNDQLKLDGRLIRHRPTRSAPVLLCHRSPGQPLLPRPARSAAAARSNETAGQTMLASTSLAERVPRRLGRRFVSVSPMPLIDGGLELLTADGALAARLQRSVHALESEFSVRTHGEIDAARLEDMRQGRSAQGARLAVRALEASGGASSNRWYRLVALGGSGHEVRQLFEHHGVEVTRVLRTRLGSLALPRTLGRGRWRELEVAELNALAGSAGSPESGR